MLCSNSLTWRRATLSNLRVCPCPRQATHASSAALAVSVGWWTGETALALSDAGGGVGLARLPGYGSLLAGRAEALRYAPGGFAWFAGLKGWFPTATRRRDLVELERVPSQRAGLAARCTLCWVVWLALEVRVNDMTGSVQMKQAAARRPL